MWLGIILLTVIIAAVVIVVRSTKPKSSDPETKRLRREILKKRLLEEEKLKIRAEKYGRTLDQQRSIERVKAEIMIRVAFLSELKSHSPEDCIAGKHLVKGKPFGLNGKCCICSNINNKTVDQH